jgi:hypothetical protein
VFFFSLRLSPAFFSQSFSQYVWVVGWFILSKAFDLNLIESKLKNWTPSVQDAEPRGGFYVIKLYDFERNFFCSPVGQREKRWHEFFLDPSQMVGSQI